MRIDIIGNKIIFDYSDNKNFLPANKRENARNLSELSN